MQSQSTPPVKSFLPTAIILALIGWIGLIVVTQSVQPHAGGRWIFLALLMLAVTGTVLPLVALFNRRFASKPPPTPLVILRQAIWVGVYVTSLAWLQYLYQNFFEEAVPISLAALLGLGFVIIEWLLRLRERSQWKPDRSA